MGRIQKSFLALCLSITFLIPSFSQAISATGDELSAEADALYAKATYQEERKKALDKYLEAVEAYKGEENFADASRNLTLGGNILDDMGELQKAVDSYKTAMDLAKSADEPDLYNHARLSEGIVLLKMGNVYKGLEALNHAIENSESNDEDFCRAVLATAIASEMLGEIDSAEKSLKDALETAKENGNLDMQANCLNRLARLELYRGNYEKAMDTWDEAFKLAWESAKREPRKLSEVAKISGTKGKGYLAIGKSFRAMESFQGAVKAYHEAGMPRHEAAALEDLAQPSYLSNRNDTAIRNLVKAIQIRNRIGVPAESAWAKGANILMDYGSSNDIDSFVQRSGSLLVKGRFALLKGNLETGLGFYKEALAHAEEKGAELDRFAALNGIGTAYERMGDRIVDPAPDALIQEMDMTPLLDPTKFSDECFVDLDYWPNLFFRYMLAYKRLVDGLAKANLSDEGQRRLEPFKSAYEKANRQIEEEFPDWPRIYRVPDDAPVRKKPNLKPGPPQSWKPGKSTFGMFELKLCGTEASKVKSQEGEWLRSLRETGLQVEHLLDEEGLSDDERREYEKFYDGFWSAWRDYNRVTFTEKELGLLHRAASLTKKSSEKLRLRPRGKAVEAYRKAADHFSKAIALTEIVRTRLDNESKGRFLNHRINGFRRTAAHEGYARVMVKTGKAEEAFKFSDFTKARCFSESLERRKLGEAIKIPLDWIEYEDKAIAQLGFMRKRRILAISQGAAANEIHRYDQEIKVIETDLKSFRKEMDKTYPSFTSTTNPKAMALNDSGLRYSDWTVAYDVTDLGTIVYLLKGKKMLNAFIVPMPRAWMNRLVAAVREPSDLTGLISLYGSDGSSRNKAWLSHIMDLNWNIHDLPRLVGGMLVEKCVEQIPDGGRLLIIPDESLYTLPFQALRLDVKSDRKSRDSNSTEFVHDRIPVYYYPSVRALTDLRHRDRKGRKAQRTLIVADHRESWCVEEAKYLRKLEPEVSDCYEGLPEPAFLIKKDLRPYRYLFFVGHGSPGYDLNETGVLLSLKDKDGPEAGIFYHTNEFMQMSLNADLACFHTCSTGIGEEIAGEVMMSLGTAALYAGAESALVTLWPTTIAYTIKWREHFFPAIYRGQSKLEALWMSHQLVWDDIQNKEDLKDFLRIPGSWAPYILIGEAD